MPQNVPSSLILDNSVDEEDIGDLSPYHRALASTSSFASSTTINSSIATESPRQVWTDDESQWGPLDSSTMPLSGTTSTPGAENSTTPKKEKSFSIIQGLQSPSSPALATNQLPPVRPRMSSRSITLPIIPTTEKESGITKTPRKTRQEIADLAVDPIIVSKMRRWILAIVVVEFDLDDGPVIDGLYPPFDLLPSESENIAFSAFPDSIQFDQGSQTHSFRFRLQPRPSGEDTVSTIDGFIYGYSHFIQRRDASSKRGYHQRSVVLLTQHPLPALFHSLVNIFGPLFEQHGTPMLEAACHNIATWSNPSPGDTIELGFLGTVLHVEFPLSTDAQQHTETSSFNEKYDPKSHILAATPPFQPPPILLFEAALGNLWSIWECLVLCEPILVFGTSPAQTSQAIWWLRDLLRPIPLAGDIRPYFTMQDSEHAQLVNKLPPKAGLLLGVTNPFFEKSCIHWPHVLSLGRRVLHTNSPRQKSPSLGAPAGPAPGWKTRTHKRYISKDRTLLKQLEQACLRGDSKSRLDASIALRRHFCSRSTQLLTPLARYLNTLIPSPNEVLRAKKAFGYPDSPLLPSNSSSPALPPSTSMRSSNGNSTPSLNTPSIPSSASFSSRSSLRLKPFNNANFLASLKTNGSLLPFKSSNKRTEFYERWLKSPAFGAWLAQQEQIVQDVLNEQQPMSSPLPASRPS
ncbi:hypothetical protein CVT24_004625 [Panaeolus cyanescens]|uniref:UDENN domain-containing protein n=1 Tax=Panaeolus cyanescens TaxID=181874 RepID=A0A409YSH2_9AGAR|nr:hypothetical protein CVT24_004625 [Panaeolus cyanescens]